MKRKILSGIGIASGLIVMNLMLSAQYEQKQVFAHALDRLRETKKAEAAVNSASITLTSLVSSSSAISSSRVTFGDLREYRFSRKVANPIPDKLKALQQKDINIAGYMIPMTDALDVKEFMLVQIPFFGCCYSVPPEPYG
jgi:hypothetical protein